MPNKPLLRYGLHIWLARRYGNYNDRERERRVRDSRENTQRFMRDNMRGCVSRGKGNRAWRRLAEMRKAEAWCTYDPFEVAHAGI